MMSKTHLAVGVASALAAISTNTISNCAISVAGGAIGGVFSDVNISNDDYNVLSHCLARFS